MTKISPDEAQQTAQAVAVLYTNWPAFRAWVDSGMSSGGRSRMGAHLAVLPARDVAPGELEAFLGRWHGCAGDAWVSVRKLAELAAQPPAVIAHIEAGYNDTARTRRTTYVLHALADQPLRSGGTAYRREMERRRTATQKPRWRVICTVAEDSGESATA
jgi:hypothetical protein